MAISDVFNFRYAPRRSWRALAVLPLIGVLVALLGPFGSYTSMDFLARCLHFATCFTFIGAGLLEGSYLVARRFFAGYWPLWIALLFDLALAFPSAGVVYVSLNLFGKATLPYVHFYDLIWQNYFVTVLVRVGVVGAALFHASQLLQAAVATPAVTGETFPLADRLPFALKRVPVLALSSEDHYLRVYTPKGEALIHMTMAEAVEALGGGFQIHRSHWIGDGTVKDHDSAMAELTTGLSLPVSRHRRKEFEAWLKTQG